MQSPRSLPLASTGLDEYNRDGINFVLCWSAAFVHKHRKSLRHTVCVCMFYAFNSINVTWNWLMLTSAYCNGVRLAQPQPQPCIHWGWGMQLAVHSQILTFENDQEMSRRCPELAPDFCTRMHPLDARLTVCATLWCSWQIWNKKNQCNPIK